MVTDIIKILAVVILSLMMVGMGMTLTIKDFKRVLVQPKAVITGVVLQLLLIPTVAWLLLQLIPATPEIAVGLMVLSACPGGPGSNLVAFMVEGDAALSVSLTAISSLYTALTLPLITGAFISIFMSSSGAIDLPLLPTTLKLFLIAVVPVMIGMVINAKWNKLAARLVKPVKLMSIIALLLLVTHVFIQQWENLPSLMSQAGVHGMLLCWGTLGFSYLVARGLRLNQSERRSIAIEVGIQNAALAIVVTTTFIENSSMAIPAIIYSPVMILMAILLVGTNEVIKNLTERKAK